MARVLVTGSARNAGPTPPRLTGTPYRDDPPGCIGRFEPFGARRLRRFPATRYWRVKTLLARFLSGMT